MSWGLGPWGLYPWGGPFSATLYLADALAIDTHTIRVTLSAAPQDNHPVLIGDVRNPRTWMVFSVDPEVYFNVALVTPFDPPLMWDLTILEDLPSFFTTCRVQSETLLDLGGSPIDDPNFVDFVGLLDVAQSTVQKKASARRFAIRDIANPPAPNVFGSLAGTLEIGSDGDYRLDEGAELLKKLIIRRIVTQRGGFSHLPGYGEGLKVKEPLPVGDLRTFQANLERQIRLEPEVKDATVEVSQDQNSLTIVVRALLESGGQQISTQLQVPFGVEL